MRTGGSARPIDTSELEPVEGDDPDRDGAGGATAVRADDDAGDAADLDEEDLRYAPRPPRRFVWARRVAAVGVVVVLATIVAVAAYQWSQGQYYVADDADQVVIFRGVQADIPGVRLHRVEESGDLALDDLPTYTQRQVRDGISATSLDDARGIVSRLERLVLCPEPAPATPDASGSPSGDGPSASASERPREGNSTPSPTRSASPSPTPSTTSPLCTEAP
jgi:protein phosphatase